MYVPWVQSKELCDAFGFSFDASGKLLIYNRNYLSGKSEAHGNSTPRSPPPGLDRLGHSVAADLAQAWQPSRRGPGRDLHQDRRRFPIDECANRGRSHWGQSGTAARGHPHRHRLPHPPRCGVRTVPRHPGGPQHARHRQSRTASRGRPSTPFPGCNRAWRPCGCPSCAIPPSLATIRARTRPRGAIWASVRCSSSATSSRAAPRAFWALRAPGRARIGRCSCTC